MVTITKDRWIIADGETKPLIYCSSCDLLNLGDNCVHGIRANGEVYNSVVCCHPPCTFHDFVKLEDWVNGEIPHK